MLVQMMCKAKEGAGMMEKGVVSGQPSAKCVRTSRERKEGIARVEE
jgi:hypothetical protein